MYLYLVPLCKYCIYHYIWYLYHIDQLFNKAMVELWKYRKPATQLSLSPGDTLKNDSVFCCPASVSLWFHFSQSSFVFIFKSALLLFIFISLQTLKNLLKNYERRGRNSPGVVRWLLWYGPLWSCKLTQTSKGNISIFYTK